MAAGEPCRGARAHPPMSPRHCGRWPEVGKERLGWGTMGGSKGRAPRGDEASRL
jgi:hypothetical protein